MRWLLTLCIIIVVLPVALRAADLSTSGWLWVDNPVPHPAEQFFCGYSHRHKFVFQHVTKAAGSSVFFVLSLALCHPPDTDPRKFPRLKDAICPKEKWDDFKFTMHLQECEKVINEHPDYFRFAFVRHPATRAVSVWKFALGWREDSRSYPRTFPAFESWIKGEQLVEGLQGTTSMTLYNHVRPQANMIADASGQLAVHFVGTVEKYFLSWLQILDKLPSLPRFRIIELLRSDTSINKSQWWEKAAQLGLPAPDAGRVLDEVYRHYKVDFELLGYSKELPPPP